MASDAQAKADDATRDVTCYAPSTNSFFPTNANNCFDSFVASCLKAFLITVLIPIYFTSTTAVLKTMFTPFPAAFI